MKFSLKIILVALIISTIAACKTKPQTSKITHIRPLSMDVFSSKDGVIKFKQGFNPKVWDADKGFSVAKMHKQKKFFPTTAFAGAEFDVIGSEDDQSKYRCFMEGRAWASISGKGDAKLGKGCHITIDGHPSSTNIIHLQEKIDDEWITVDSYVFPKKVNNKENIEDIKWARILNKQYKYINDNYDYKKAIANDFLLDFFPALTICRNIKTQNYIPVNVQQLLIDQDFRKQFLFMPNELTNSPYAQNLAANKDAKSFYARDLDGTFMGEWGHLYKYKKSSFALGGIYLTAMLNADGSRVLAVDELGNIIDLDFSAPSVIACR